ncbi:hypothetical protein ACFV6E_39955 [Streptomyces sp. NPDC059785]|uniref:hypothetical protein n=1 Tax=unclassified Streptomyces TaxID=2593676 RepID=UPI003646B1F8
MASDAASDRAGHTTPDTAAQTAAGTAAHTAAEAEPTTFLYVHGAGNKPPEDILKRAWDQDLFQRDMGPRTRMVYYADLLHDSPAAITADACTGDSALAALVSDAFAGTVPLQDAEVRDAVAAMSAEGAQFVFALSTGMAARAAAPAPRVTVAATAAPGSTAVAELLPLPNPLRQFLLRQLLRHFIPDANAYFFTAARQGIQDRLRAALDAVDGRAVVVSHSLGTVVAYEVLGESRFARADVPLLMTMGSPLGYTEIQDRLRRPLRIPQPVRLWTNFADPLDLVTLDTTLADDFRDTSKVIADIPVDNRSPNNHAACGYLRTRQVRNTAAAAQ